MGPKDLKNIQGIYKINFPNGKCYIGLSNQIRTRIKEHINKDYREHPNLPISKAINKYGITDVEILEEVQGDRQLLQEREKYWIQYYDSTNREKGYNLSPGGDGTAEGCLNHQAKLNNEQILELYDLLLNSTLTYEELGEKFNLDRISIGRINAGTHYFSSELNYPLRKTRIDRFDLDNKQSAFYGKEEELNNLYYDLQYTQISYDELQKKYDIKLSTLSLINRGKKYHNSELKYPLRPKNELRKRIFSMEELIFIKEELEKCELTMKEIGKKVSCSSETISSINKGLRQKQSDWEYPLRKQKMKTGPKPQ